MVNISKNSVSGTQDAGWAETIKDLRAKLDLTQEQFAAKVGMTWSIVNRWENGSNEPAPLALRRIEEVRTEVT